MSERLIFHIDMNSFFASCEQAMHPELKNLPIAVVGDASRRSGIVLAASYEAKAFGVRTTMPIHEALKCLPTLKLVSSTYGLYGTMSKKVMDIFDLYTPLKEQLSIDEAYLDMTGTDYLFGTPLELAQKIMHHLQEELSLGCSVGISNNKLLAKMASNMKKPLGITTLYIDEIEEKLWPLKIHELYGVGKKTVPKLVNMGIKTIGELASTEKSTLIQNFGEKFGQYLYAASHGEESDVISTNTGISAKSVGNELTYRKDIYEVDEIKNELLLLADTVAYRLRRKMLQGKTLQIKIKYSDFTSLTRSVTFQRPTDSTDYIFEQAFLLIKENRGSKPIRLLGISITNFEAEVIEQLSLFQDTIPISSSKLDTMVDTVREKFGYEAIQRASIKDKKHGH